MRRASRRCLLLRQWPRGLQQTLTALFPSDKAAFPSKAPSLPTRFLPSSGDGLIFVVVVLPGLQIGLCILLGESVMQILVPSFRSASGILILTSGVGAWRYDEYYGRLRED